MRRREFIKLLGGAGAAWPLSARGQQPAGKMSRVGILSPAGDETAGTLAAFRQGMRDLGYVEGRTISLDFRLSKGHLDALPALAAELVGIPVDVIVTDTSSAGIAAFAATRTIPIVMAITGGDPVALGLAKSYARPGGNLTGMRFRTDLSEKRLQLLKQAFPRAERVALLVNPKIAIAPAERRSAELGAEQLRLRLLPLDAATPDELVALTPAALANADGLVVVPDGMFWNNRKTIVDLAARSGVPAIYPEREYADDGGLIGYGPNAPEHFRQAASYVDRILRGAKPADLPINASSRFDFVVNLRTARAFGFNLPADFISAAAEVIE
jgi:putative tryptophan/tyrosine transport system substrate-binding protein